MESYFNIPVIFSPREENKLFVKVPVEESIKQFISFLIETRQGECFFNKDFGYEIWANEFEPIQDMINWQSKFIEDIKNLLKKYEPRISEIYVKEPKITPIEQKSTTDKDFSITIILDYTIIQTGERQPDVKITFEF